MGIIPITELHKLGLSEPQVTVPDGDAKKGALVFKKKCATCHTCDKNGSTKAGPNLYGLFGRSTGQALGFQEDQGRNNHGETDGVDQFGMIAKLKSMKNAVGERWYSDANIQAGIVWSDKHLWYYLEDPRKYIPGTKMVHGGIKKEDERANLIEYMRLICGSSAPGYGCPYIEE